MKQKIQLGAYGWRHDSWMGTYFPDDIPVGAMPVDDLPGGGLPAEKDEDWRLAYYSNDFDCVLVPANYWQSAQGVDCGVDCKAWLDDVHEDFQFFIECRESMFESVSLAELTKQLTILRPQLSALVFLDEEFHQNDMAARFETLADSLGREVFASSEKLFLPTKILQQPVWKIDNPHISRFACIEDDLTDLRTARVLVEQFTGQVEDLASTEEPVIEETTIAESTIIVKHPQLQVMNLSKFKAVLQVMGH